MFSIYILQPLKDNRFYIGYTAHLELRLQQHNETSMDSYTSKFRPWIMLACISIGNDESEAIRIERYIKKQKQRRFILLVIEKCGDPDFIVWLKNKCSVG